MLPLRSMTRFAFWAQSRKNIQVSRHFKVVGAEIDGSDTAVSRGIISVGAPAQKRLAMSNLSLRVAVSPRYHQGLCSSVGRKFDFDFPVQALPDLPTRQDLRLQLEPSS